MSSWTQWKTCQRPPSCGFISRNEGACIALSERFSSIRWPARYHRCWWRRCVLFCHLILYTHFVSVLELVESLVDPDDAYKRKLKKGVHHVDIFYVLSLFIPMLIALNDRLKSFSPAPSPSDLVHSSYLVVSLSLYLTPPLFLYNGLLTTSKKSKFLVQISNVLPSTSGVRLRFTKVRHTVRMRSRNSSM